MPRGRMPELATTIAIPVWAVVVLWAVGGYVVALRVQTAIMAADLVGRPALARKLLDLSPVPRYGLVAVAVVLTGPLVWCSILREAAEESGKWLRGHIARWWAEREATLRCKLLGHFPTCDHRTAKIEAGELHEACFCSDLCARCKRCGIRLRWDGSCWVPDAGEQA